jgi:tetratricopeptide (TPR) repeat protein
MTKTVHLLSLVVAFVLIGAPLTRSQEPPTSEEETTPAQETAPTQETAPAQESAPVQEAPSVSAAAESFQRALRYYRTRDFNRALGELRQVAEVEPNRADVLYLMGYSHYILKQFDDSLEAFRRTFEEDPEFDPRTIY